MSSPNEPTTVFCLHFLGGSAREWDGVRLHLDGTPVACVTIDLAGFGEAAANPGYSVAEMTECVAGAIRARAPARWLIAGHSMGAKIAACLARRAEDGEAALAGLVGLVLLAGSPPGPEPMAEATRQEMLAWFAGPAQTSRDEAERYVARNVGAPLQATTTQQAVNDVLRAHPKAWTAWLESGSREDWSQQVGVLRTPTLLIAGGEDADLGPAAQQALARLHFVDARLVVLDGAGHLLPLERPEAVARLIAEHAAHPPTGISEAYWRLLRSGRVSTRTRDALLARTAPADETPAALTSAERDTLRAVMARVLPQPGPALIDLAAAIDRELAEGTGDGWRHARLPPDRLAYSAGLRSLDMLAESASFARLDAGRQDKLLHRIAASGADAPEAPLDAAQMRLWFEDVRADAVRHYVAHPATLSRIGYSGIGYGGDGEPKPGFVHTLAGERDEWEPIPDFAA